MIVSGGENVFPVEIENLLVAHPGITEAAVLGMPDRDFGQRLCAFVVPAGSQRLDADDVRRYVKDNARPSQGAARRRVPRAAAPERHRQAAATGASAVVGRLKPTGSFLGSGRASRGGYSEAVCRTSIPAALIKARNKQPHPV